MLSGKGTYVFKKTGAVYDGDWKDDKKEGYGVWSEPHKDQMVKKYVGHWKAGKKEVGYTTKVTSY